MKAIYRNYICPSGNSHDEIVAVFSTEQKALDFKVLLDEEEKLEREELNEKFPLYYHTIDDYIQFRPKFDPVTLNDLRN